MQRDEFVKLHGEEAWEKLVHPKLTSERLVVRSNANIFTHLEIVPVLELLGFKKQSLLEAKKELKKLRAKK